jgi:hypothetical protein
MKSQGNLKMEKGMNKSRCRLIWQVVFLCGMILWVSGCSSSNKLWYKAGNNQADFDLDTNECIRIAKEVGRQATITGERINPDVYNTTYSNCIFSRGWTHTPPGTEQKSVRPVEMATVKGNEIHVFARLLKLPVDFQLIRNQTSRFGDVNVQTLFFQGDGPVYLNMDIVETLSRQFDFIEYPAHDPFFVFEKGKGKKKNMPVNWTVFSGDFKGTWVAGIGAYYLVDKNKRINLVMTKDIPSQNKPPPDGLKLTRIQKQAVESFSDQWLEKVETGFGVNEMNEKNNLVVGSGKNFIQWIGSFF